MTFATPGYLLLLLALPVAAALIARWLAWRASARRLYGIAAVSPFGPALAPLLLLAAIAIAVLAAARPQFGSHASRVNQRGIDLVIVLDVSGSMLADDVQPSRLARSQAEIDALLDRLTGDRVGLVVFARKPFVRAPLTSDLRALRTIVDGVDRERALVEPGSDLGGAIGAGETVLARGTADTKAMLIVSDGEDHGTSIAAAIDGLRAARIRVYTAGAGTTAGAAIRDVDRATGASRPRLDASGAPVVTHLDAEGLRRIADAGNGRYIALAGGDSPLTILVPEFDSLARTTFESKSSSQPIERFQIFAAIAFLLLAGEIIAPRLRQPSQAWRSALRLWPLGAAGLLVGAVCSTSAANVNRRGNDEYARSRYDPALSQYRTAEALAPGRAELNHNAGNADDRAGDFTRAIDETRAGQSDRADITAKLAYALGNHYIGAQRIPDAIGAYKRALLADPSDADAKRNLEIASARLTATASPAMRSPERPTPPPGGDRTPGAGNTPGSGAPGGTPAATAATGGEQSGTPQAGDRRLTREQLQRALDEALAGINEQLSEDDALRILELLDQQNRRAFEDAAPGGNPSTAPDY